MASRTIIGCCCVFLLSLPVLTARGRDADPLVLAENGTTRYAIIIAAEPVDADEHAAKELALFLNEMTGAEFPIRRADAPASAYEIVIGTTARKSRADLPENLKDDNWENFTLLREDAKLYILGNIPRATLYGVYDFLDVELGVRFLTHEVNHVPRRPTLKVDMASRTFSPRVELRAIWEVLGGASIVRNRMNGQAFYIPYEKMLGGVKRVGPKTHTFNKLVPMDKYFDEHPEFFSEIDGVRAKPMGRTHGSLTQLCLTNPDVLLISLNTIRGWLGPAVAENPYNKYLVNVTVNDNPYFCKCAPCVAVNKEEGVVEGGTKMRFVNALARQLAREYPNVSIETMVYHTSMPKKTRPVSNVIMQMVVLPEFGVRLDDPAHEHNRKCLKQIREWKEAVGDGTLYGWTRLGTYGTSSYLDPRPNLHCIARNLNLMVDAGMVGYFIQTVQSRDTQMQALRYYMLARALWRPETDDRELMEEFCRPYYGGGADGVLRYIDYLHKEHGQHDKWQDDRVWNDRFVAEGDAILADAEAAARTPETKLRVAVCRLPIWKLKLDRAFGEIGKVVDLPIEWSFRTDPDDKGLKEGWQKTTDFAGWQTMRTDDYWTNQGEEHRGVAWYGINFEMPDIGGAPAALWFGAIDGKSEMFLDGVKVGEQQLPPTATMRHRHGFFIPLKNTLAPGTHTLAVRVVKPNYSAGIWRPVAVIDMSVPISDELRRVGERFLAAGRASKLTHISYSYAGPDVQTHKFYYPKVEFFLTHGRSK